jgi:hypothetical protein
MISDIFDIAATQQQKIIRLAKTNQRQLRYLQ